MKDRKLASYLRVWLQEATGQVHQPGDLVWGTIRAAKCFRWQFGVPWFSARKEFSISQPLTSASNKASRWSAATSLRAAALGGRYMYQTKS